jgi:hypothetical protein
MPAPRETKFLLDVATSDHTDSSLSLDLAVDLEKCCFREPLLGRAYRRIYVDAPGKPLGLSWPGTLEFIIDLSKQLGALRDAVFVAFGHKQIRIKITRGPVVAELDMHNADLEQVGKFFKDVCSAIESD